MSDNASGQALLIDVGNSRLKWSIGLGAEAEAGAMAYQRPEDIASAPLWQRLRAGVEVWVASVARAEIRAAIAEACAPAALHWARSEAERDGLCNGYREPERLGVDRWLAMLAIWRQRRDAFVVVDAGSAITVDWVGSDGRHLGGHIVPGLQLLIRALRVGTAQVTFEPQAWQSLAPGHSTDEAVFQGLLTMAVGYLTHALEKCGPLQRVPVYLTGGDAALLQAHLGVATELRPQLVLEGLAAFAADDGGR
jgi:type III pantothenate kinase